MNFYDLQFIYSRTNLISMINQSFKLKLVKSLVLIVSREQISKKEKEEELKL